MMSITTSSAKTSGLLRELPRRLESHAGVPEVLAALQARQPATLDGVWGSCCALVTACLLERVPQTLVVVLPRAQEIDELGEELGLFTGVPLERFPARETALGDRTFDDEIYGDRLRLLKELLVQPPRLIVTCIQSLLQPVPSPEMVNRGTQQIRVGQRIPVEHLTRWLAANKLHATSAVELPGEFSHRGGILDIFAPDWREPVRIEFFDDQIESLRLFDIASQRSLGTLESVEITMLEPSAAVSDHFSRFLPEGTWFLLAEPQQIVEEGTSYLQRVERPDQYHSVPQVLSEVNRFGHLSTASLAAGALGATARLRVESVERFSGDISRVREELDRLGENQEVYVVTSTEAEVERLAELLGKTQLAAAGRLHFPLGNLRSGFRLLPEQMLLVSSRDLFHRGELRRTPRRRLGKAIDSFLDLREGDLVVHLAHGIGRYRGLERLSKEGRTEEHLIIEFHGGTKLYVPASKIDLVQKYVGGTKSHPTLARIGGTSWLRQKKAAEEAVNDLAAELLEVQASRASRPGIAFSPDSEWQREFDASFPYTETSDQLAAIEAIKGDMQRPRPMDRLLCGDVGFGKTEVAMRAAFKAVDNGYQVALLAPTTILVEQHYQTFGERMIEFPFEIAKLSRFCSSKEERETLAGLASGKIDIVVGTHRLASRDVQFHNLGLVIIDEEQRFGVEVKERLKQLRTTVDVLTTTATPIPRTLHMSLVGVRDISNLETAPLDRVAVETRVTRFDADLIRHAVLRELSRGGQIYFVHNRVQDIEIVSRRLKQIVPEARLRIGHGQMAEGELEQVMVDFVAHRFDLLLATTIVESGLDIPNANTIFIDEADRYGLADLHQLRGRVGRYKHRAYCYLLIDPGKHVTPNAAKRLHAIEEYSDMGAGFALAMRDLEIRGAGNLLGTQQSGHIAAVGYELYCQLLDQAVRSLKQLPPQRSLDVELSLPGEALIPDDYVPDLRLKIDLYRRLARISDLSQIQEMESEFLDRFGPLPQPVRRMLALAELKIDAAIWQVRRIFVEGNYLVFEYADRRRIEQLAKRNGRRLRVVDEESAYLPLSDESREPERLWEAAKSVLQAG